MLSKLLQTGVMLAAVAAPLIALPAWSGSDSASSSPLQIAQASRRRVTFTPRKNQPRPKFTIGGGRRSQEACPGDQQSASAEATKSLTQRLTFLSPIQNPQGIPSTSDAPPPLTLAARPTLMVYVPPTSAKQVELTLYSFQNQREKGIYQTTLSLPETPGIVRLSLPSHAPSLEVGEDYKWVVTLVCQGDRPSPSDPFVEQLVRRVELDGALSEQLVKAKGLDRVAAFGEAGIWYEMVSELATLQQSQGSNAESAATWSSLLGAAGLGDLAQVPVK